MVDTSRVPLTRLNSTSVDRATCCISNALRPGSDVQNVSATIGTSSIPFGLTTGSPTPRLDGSQSRFECTVS
jgi:hypothetical protein